MANTIVHYDIMQGCSQGPLGAVLVNKGCTNFAKSSALLEKAKSLLHFISSKASPFTVSSYEPVMHNVFAILVIQMCCITVVSL